MLPQRQNSPFTDRYFCWSNLFQVPLCHQKRQSFPFRDRDVCYSNLFQPPLCCHIGRVPLSGMETFVIQIFFRRHNAATQTEFPFQGVRRLLFKSVPGATMPPQRQNYLYRDRDVCYSNLFKTPLCCHRGRIPLSGKNIFIGRIYSSHHYAATQAEFPFQGKRRLLFKSFPGTTMLPQRQSFPFRDRYVCYSNLFQAPLCCHTGRVPLSGRETFVIQILSRHNYAATNTEFLFQGYRRFLFEAFQDATMLPQRQNSPFSNRYFCRSNLFQAPLCHHKGRVSLSGIETFVIRIYSSRHYAVTQAEFPFQGVRRLLFKSFQGTTMLPQRRNSSFRD